jgi:DNA-binding ferritin-like protein
VRTVKKDKQLNTILDECLERILVNGETVPQCLESYPEYAAELEPLLQTAMITSEAVDIQPSPEFKARARFELRVEMARADEKKRRSIFAWQPRWAVVVVTVVVVVLLGGGTVLAADSDNTIPGNPLYAVKLATENVRLALSSSDITKAELCATLIDRRVAEIERLIERGRTELAQRTVNRLKRHLATLSRLSLAIQSQIGPEAEDVETVTPEEPSVKPDVSVQDAATTALAEERAQLQVLWGRYIVNHPDEIRAMLEEASLAVKPALTRAIVDSVNSYVNSYQKVLQELKESQSSTSDEAEPSTTNQQPDSSDTGPGTSNQQSGNSAQPSGDSSLAPNATDVQASAIK